MAGEVEHEAAEAHGARPVVMARRLPHLPLNELEWESYELLLRRIAQDERGLRRVRLYGSRGQSQFGIDLAGQAPDGVGEAIQAKRYTTFAPADLTAAVAKFVQHRDEIPFGVDRLFVAASCDCDRRQIADELYRLTEAHPDVEIEFWDRRTQCDMLRRRRDIVAEFFGDAAVDAFCYPAPTEVVAAAEPDRVEFADALMRGPAQITGAQAVLSRADGLQADDPDQAAAAVAEAIDLLRRGGFAAHAALLLPRRAQLLGQAGRHDDAVRLLSREFWQAVDSPYDDDTNRLVQAMRTHDLSPTAQAMVDIAEEAIDVLRAPLGVPALDRLAGLLSTGTTTTEAARLMLLAAQTAAVDPRSTWRSQHVAELAEVADRIDAIDGANAERVLVAEERSLAVLLRCEVADETGDWTELLSSARRYRLPRRDSAGVLARYAMWKADRGQYDEADQAWADATEQSCLAGDHARAASWVYARRILSSRFQGFNPEFQDSPRLVRALYTISGGPPRQQQRLNERALEALAEGKPYRAVPLLRSLLRVAHLEGGWGEVLETRELLAKAYRSAHELGLAVSHLVLAGRAAAAEEMAKEAADSYLDVRSLLQISPAYWVPASAFRVVAAQADVVPDDQVEQIVGVAVTVLQRVRAKTLRDTPLFSPSLSLAALQAVAALARRLPEAMADTVLDFLSPHVLRRPNSYRHTDNSHVQVCISIAHTHASFAREGPRPTARPPRCRRLRGVTARGERSRRPVHGVPAAGRATSAGALRRRQPLRRGAPRVRGRCSRSRPHHRGRRRARRAT